MTPMPPTDNPVELAEEAVATRLIADALYARSKDLSARAAAAMGRGTLYPKLADGTELAQFTVPADALTVTIDETQLLPWVQEHYPSELMHAIRPAFIEAIRAKCRALETVCGPGGEADVPGVSVDYVPKTPAIRAKQAGKDRAAAAVDAVLSGALESFATPAIEGEK